MIATPHLTTPCSRPRDSVPFIVLCSGLLEGCPRAAAEGGRSAARVEFENLAEDLSRDLSPAHGARLSSDSVVWFPGQLRRRASESPRRGVTSVESFLAK